MKQNLRESIFDIEIPDCKCFKSSNIRFAFLFLAPLSRPVPSDPKQDPDTVLLPLPVQTPGFSNTYLLVMIEDILFPSSKRQHHKVQIQKLEK